MASRFVAASASAAVALTPLRAAGAPTGAVCSDPRVVVEGRLGERWLEPVVSLCESLATLPDVDPSARLRIAPASDGVIAEVSLADGRVALRRVQDPMALRSTILALLSLPPEPEPDAPPVKATTPAVVSARLPPRPPGEPVPHEPRLGVQAGMSFATRLSRAPTYFSAGASAHADVRIGAWLVGLLVRWEPWQNLASAAPPGFEMDTIGAGFGVSRRIPLGDGLTLEAGATAILLNETESTQLGEDEKAGAATDVRVGAVARALVGGGPWFFSPSLEAEVSPARVRRDLRIDDALPPLPSWSIAAGLGFTWATQ